MQQVYQSYRNGEVGVATVPVPQVRRGTLLVQSVISLVSTSTEKAMMQMGQKSLLAKAKSRPDDVAKLMIRIQQEGLSAVNKAFSKLEAPVPMGYSCAGIVREVGEGVEGFSVGDRVACAGAGVANHAEWNVVPQNLATRIPDDVSFEGASFTTLGAIALQGVRQAEVTLGETVVVTGLGLIGLLTVQILKAAGCVVIGCDPVADKRALAQQLGADAVAGPDELPGRVDTLTGGKGADAVIITAATPSSEPVRAAGKISRHKGRVIIVGNVGLDVPRDIYYKKELDLRLSMSYGPGRYDPNYEDRGLDYPFSYVRWTEKRNMESFLRLIAQGAVTPMPLVTHRFPIDHAMDAYDLLKNPPSEPCIAILISYDTAAPAEAAPLRRVPVTPPAAAPLDAIAVGFLGAGEFARGVLLPAVRKLSGISLKGIATASGLSAWSSAKKFGFEYAATDENEILRDPAVSAVVIATRHHLHADQVVRSLEAGKHVFVEKPLALTEGDLDRVGQALERAGNRQLVVDFNRRFSPLAVAMHRVFAARKGPAMITYRINAGGIPKESWVQNRAEGGGRMLGEVCHFADLLVYLIQSPITEVHALPVPPDSAQITCRFADGSVGVIDYATIGDPSLPKERVEMFAENRAAVLDDFRSLTVHQNGKKSQQKNWTQDKGHAAALAAFFNALRTGAPSPLPFADIDHVTRVTLAIERSLARCEAAAV